MAVIEPIKYKLKDGREVIIRSLRSEDAESNNEFRRKLSTETKFTLHYEGMDLPSIEETKRWIESYENNPQFIALAAFDGDAVIAGLSLSLPRPNHPWAGHVGYFGMAVLENYSGNGIATQLLRTLDGHAIKVGVTRIEATVRTENIKAVNLYKKCGYTIEGTRKSSTYIDGKFHDEFFIAKLFI